VLGDPLHGDCRLLGERCVHLLELVQLLILEHVFTAAHLVLRDGLEVVHDEPAGHLLYQLLLGGGVQLVVRTLFLLTDLGETVLDLVGDVLVLQLLQTLCLIVLVGVLDELLFEKFQVLVQVLVSLDVQTLELEHADLFLLYVLDDLAHVGLAVEHLLHARFVDAVAHAALVNLVEEGLGQLVLVVVEDLLTEQVERYLSECARVAVAYLEAVELAEDTCEHLGDYLQIVPLACEHVEQVLALLVLDLLDHLGAYVFHHQFLVAVEHAAIALLVFRDLHDHLLVVGHQRGLDFHLVVALQEVQLHRHQGISDVCDYLVWLGFV